MTYETMIYSISIIVISVIIDMIIGEVPNKFHPVIFMGNLIDKLKNYLPNTKFSGLLIILTTIFVFATISLILLIIFAYLNIWLFVIFSSILLSTTFSINFLIDSVRNIQYDLEEDIEKARKSMSYLVSRNTSELTESRITSAAIETLTENITDSIFSPLFYTTIFSLLFGIIAGIIAAVIYRVSNTMDAMLGYKTKELINIGCYPAKLDDLLNYIPARITGYYVVLASFILQYDYKQSYDVMKKFALKTPSPNSGYPMAATAGALNITLIKEGVYELGYGKDELNKEKISEAINITKVTSLLFILTIVVIYFIVMFLIL
ncbi:MAG: cobalamin biosynthesis protein [Methanosphaera stadtmanae]|nr:cobalamin biosynthesis protein [Methanosphaera stadtmanae]